MRDPGSRRRDHLEPTRGTKFTVRPSHAGVAPDDQASGDDPDVGALLITGAGSAFCSGGDVKGMGGNSAAPAMSFSDKVARLKERQRTLTGVLVSVRKPTIAALPGPAAGAGLAIALACDIRIAAESTIMTTGYARIALTGDYGISWLLTRLAGTARARELMFLSERIDARRCEALGLVNRVVPDADLQKRSIRDREDVGERSGERLCLHQG